MGPVAWELVATCPHTGARRGRLHTAHGTVETPFFMPVATVGTVKGVPWEQARAAGFELVLSNTYHLALRPGAELVRSLGGLAEFTGWRGPTLTDSGGYQVMSLAATSKVNDEGVKFKSHLDGTELFLSPEKSIEIQWQLGVDIAMALDQCPPYPCTPLEAEQAMRRTHAWAHRNLGARREGQAVFGICQGGVHAALRAESAAYLSGLPFDGYAIGGVCVGEPTEMQRPVVRQVAPLLPAEKPRYLMGVGHPADILHAVACGVDMFDCVLPTRQARHHSLYTLGGRVNIRAAKWKGVSGPVDPGSVFPPLEGTSAAYLRHLFVAGEQLGPLLASLHNLWFYGRLMHEVREAITGGTWPELMARYALA